MGLISALIIAEIIWFGKVTQYALNLDFWAILWYDRLFGQYPSLRKEGDYDESEFAHSPRRVVLVRDLGRTGRDQGTDRSRRPGALLWSARDVRTGAGLAELPAAVQSRVQSWVQLRLRQSVRASVQPGVRGSASILGKPSTLPGIERRPARWPKRRRAKVVWALSPTPISGHKGASTSVEALFLLYKHSLVKR